ncbi:8237_t:CDS:2, partial [Racocetra persica]
DDIFNHIKFSGPVVTIGDCNSTKIDDESGVWNNISEFISEDYSTSCIACWVAKPLHKSIMEEISKLFDYKFRVVYHLVNVKDISNGSNDHCEITSETSIKDLEICVSPIPIEPSNTSNIIMINEKHPRRFNNTINISNGHEHDFHIQVEGGTTFGATASYDKKNSRNTMTTLKEWDLQNEFDEIDCVRWAYRFIGDEIYDDGEHRKTLTRTISILVIGLSWMKWEDFELPLHKCLA